MSRRIQRKRILAFKSLPWLALPASERALTRPADIRGRAVLFGPDSEPKIPNFRLMQRPVICYHERLSNFVRGDLFDDGRFAADQERPQEFWWAKALAWSRGFDHRRCEGGICRPERVGEEHAAQNSSR